MTITLDAHGRDVAAATDDSPLHRLVEDAFTGLAGSAAHPCPGARSVVHRKAYELHLYTELGTTAAARRLWRDLVAFGSRVDPSRLTSLVAVFEGPSPLSEPDFDTLLWRQLQAVHDIDSGRHPWDPRVSADPGSPHFSFSVGGQAFFVIGLHGASSRWARRFAWPALVFNPHRQFTELRDSGTFERFRSLARARDTELQGTINPMLDDHGADSEARQYSGRVVDDDWDCPLQVREPR